MQPSNENQKASRIYVKTKQLVYFSIPAVAVLLFLVLAPVASPAQFGMDICPSGLISHNAFFRVSITYLYFRFGGVYWGGVGYNFYTGYFC